MIEIGLLIYWVTGVLLATVGPVKRSIQREVDDARGTDFSNEILGRQTPSETKLIFSNGQSRWDFLCCGLFCFAAHSSPTEIMNSYPTLKTAATRA